MIGFAGRRVIEETVRETLPKEFQTAEYLRDHGLVDIVAPRNELKNTLARLLDLLMLKSKTGTSVGQGGNGLKGQPRPAVFVRIEIEQREDFRCQPSGAHLVARESRAIRDEDVPSVLMKHSGARRSSRTAADHERIAAHHPATRGASYGSDRVHDGGDEPRGMNTI